ncbi:MAG TPA: sn-glycerol-3-phosphate ABC transporter ATP-binding protein UgpC [Leucothrix sp.]|nr:sn-glycerol-3-phosphate ABC transporter ATP-binding protein UgpC [Leucothrix sp.]
MSHILLKGVEKIYPNGYKAIHGVDIEIEEGEFIVLVGPSGCGKSTLLRMIAGLETITSGEVHIAGRKVNELEPSQRDIAMVFQNYALYPHMTVYKNMAYGLKNLGTPKDEIDRRVSDVAKLLEIEELMQRKPKQLSGGQRQRVAMGRAIVRKPTAFLFDEPLSNLDAKLRVQMRLVIKNLQARLGTTTLYVTHDQVEAMTMADRLIVLNAGIAEQIGTPMELYEKPKTRFVAGFIGSPAMNFIDVKLSSDGLKFHIGDNTLLLDKKLETQQSEVIFGFRPEHLVLDSDGTIPLKIELIEHLGAESIIHAKLDLGDNTSSNAITLRLNGHTNEQNGNTVKASIAPEYYHFFNRESGHRIG